jgi:hypothetical protein
MFISVPALKPTGAVWLATKIGNGIDPEERLAIYSCVYRCLRRAESL